MPTIGLISDTHGLLRPEALAALEGSDYIVHAGDIMDPAILERLARIAPVTAVRGNNDHGAWAEEIPGTAVLRIDSTVIYALHDLADLDVDPAAAGFQVVVPGHSHKPASAQREGVWFVNPGSAGPRRFTLPISVGRLRIKDGTVAPELIELPFR